MNLCYHIQIRLKLLFVIAAMFMFMVKMEINALIFFIQKLYEQLAIILISLINI